ncbi:Acetoin catabolism protein X [Vibrio nigripulchritudo SOn1]|uniref:Acetoin catabolism protein X n=1 Tax=Vibrio nigripulchritudo SOn1 TaxID=1238450 RepID=A0AAV2VV08_9VIBR|nr:NAD(+)/NADH kinase [Vibrio nigripulchritudo]CCO48450.1 Acetoin catabolism protein X [Vibrio nigripulchritudo SOn1]
MNQCVVGMIANPVSARDIRRVVAASGSLTLNDRVSIVLKILSGLKAGGVHQVWMMPDKTGLSDMVQREVNRGQAALYKQARSKQAGSKKTRERQGFPELKLMPIPTTGTEQDTINAALECEELKVSAIVVLGGDGTHRLVVKHARNIPITGYSTGTNNAFPETIEPSLIGLATALYASGQIPKEAALSPNKLLRLRIQEKSLSGVEGKIKPREDIALVDVAITSERFVGSKAVWQPDTLRAVYVTFASAMQVGLSSIIGLSAPVERTEPCGRFAELSGDASASFLTVPLVPGVFLPVAIQTLSTLNPNQPVTVDYGSVAIALDGEREHIVEAQDDVTLELIPNAFFTINVEACMNACAARMLLRNQQGECDA